MSFVVKNSQRLKTPEQCARELLDVALERELDDFAAVLAVMCVAQESDFWCPWNRADPSSEKYPHDSESNDGRSVAYFQQQNGAPGEVVTGRDNWWGPMGQRMDLKASGSEFLARLTDNYRDAVDNPALASEFIANVQRCREDLRGAYAKHWDRAHQLVAAAKNGVHVPAKDEGFRGDPVWLSDVLGAALGDRLVIEEGWEQRGTGGTMGDIFGVMIHHTGNSRESVEVIRDGRPDLAGPLSQCLIKPTGKCHLIAVGPCNHAGIGDYPGVGRNRGNERLIGFECAWPTIGPGGSYDPHERWPDAQIITMRDATAAVLKKLAYDQTHVIGHKDYATAPPNVKWDPGNLSMEWFRQEVGKDLRGEFDSEPPVPPVVPPIPLPVDYARQTWEQSRGRWAMLGDQTLVEAVAELRDKITGSSDRNKTGVRFD